jgi:hypothetical protein
MMMLVTRIETRIASPGITAARNSVEAEMPSTRPMMM